MSLSSSKLAGGSLLLTSVGENRLPTKPSAMTTTRRALPLQVRSEEKQESVPPKAFNVSRRDAMLSLPTATVAAALTFFSVEPAEARIVKPETRRKIQEKLKMLGEKAGVSKRKTNDGKEPSPLSEDKTLLSSPPAPQGSPIVPPVEAVLP